MNNSYYQLLKNPQNLNNNQSYGVLGGKISNFLNLSNNEFMVTFWFKFDTNQNNKVFPFITLFNDNIILKEYLYYSDLNYISQNIDKNLKIPVYKNSIIFFIFKFKFFSGQVLLNIELFTEKNLSKIFSQQFNTIININNIIFIINRLNLQENLIIENLIFYNTIDDYTNEELMNGVPNIIYFINFRHNYPNTKWLNNEIKNEFGPAYNGDDSDIKFYNLFYANFNNATKELEWQSSFRYSEMYFSHNIIPYLNRFEFSFSFNLFLKFDYYINYFNDRGAVDTSREIIELFNFVYFLSFKINTSKDVRVIFIISRITTLYLIDKTIPYNTMYKGRRFIEGSYLDFNFLMINITKQFHDTHYKFVTHVLFKNNSLMCNTSCLHRHEVLFDRFDKNENKLKISSSNPYFENIILIFFLKELITGTGNLKIENENDVNNLIIKSKNVINPFLVYNNQIIDLERRFSFNDNTAHSTCSVSNCSICRKNWNICEYCYVNYYLENGICLLNSDNTKFINNYSLLKNTDYEENTLTKNSYGSYNYIDFTIPSFTNYFLYHYYIHFENNNSNDILVYFYTRRCHYEVNLYYSKITTMESTFRISSSTNNLNCVNRYSIKNYNEVGSNELTNFLFKINKESINCDQGFKDIYCDYGCSRNTNFLLKFDENHLFYSTCSEDNIANYLKNNGIFKYYNRCPRNCKYCDIDSNKLIFCTECHKGYFLKNKECILKLMVNCQIENNFSISNENSEINWFTCTNYCSYINEINNNNNNSLLNLVNYYPNNQICENKDNIILKCINSNTHYYNYFRKECIACPNVNCFNFECNNCLKVNNFSSCSNNFKFFENTCILINTFDINCIKYELNSDNNFICNKCKNNYYLYNNQRCYERSTRLCLKYINKSHICEICNDGFFLNIRDKKCYNCDINCVTCINTYNKCISCKYNYILENNKCVYNKLYSNNCQIFNDDRECINCNNGYYLNKENKCTKCNVNCKTCLDDRICKSCFNNYNLDLNTKSCIKNLKNCIKINLNNVFQCLKCYSGYFIKNNKCEKCNSNCLSCENYYNNCLDCHKNGILKFYFQYNYCQYNCNFNEYKIYNNQNTIGYLNTYNFYNYIINKKLFILINIPNKIYEDILKIDKMKKSILLELENNIIDYKLYIDIKYKKISIIPLINSFKKNLKLKLTIKSNIFEKIKICKIEEKIINIKIKNNNLDLYENDIVKENNKKYPIYNKNSTKYKNIKKVYIVSKNTSEIIIYNSLFISLFSPSILSKISIYLPTLLYFNYLLLLKIDFGKNVNTLISFFDYNSKIIDMGSYINLNTGEVEKKIQDIIIHNPRLINIKILFINYFTLKYVLLCLLLFIMLLIKFIEYILILIENILKRIIRKKKNIIISISTNKNNNNLENRQSYDKLNLKFKLKKWIFKSKNIIKKINIFINKYFISFLSIEMPNIILIFTIYATTIKHSLLNLTSVFINLIFFYNTILIIYYLAYINLIIRTLKNKNSIDYNVNIRKILIPFNNINYNNLWIYYKIVENLRIIVSLIIIIYLNENIIVQISFLLFIQLLYLIYIILSFEKKLMILILTIKEFGIFIFLNFILWTVIMGFRIWIENILVILIILIFLVSVIEFLFSIIKKNIELLKKIYNFLKNKSKRKEFKKKNIKHRNRNN